MKQVTIGATSILVGAFAVIQPLAVFAESATATPPRPANFCVAIENITVDQLDRFEAMMNRQTTRRTIQDDHVDVIREKVDAKRIEIMDKFGMRRDGVLSKLATRSSSSTDALDPEVYREMQDVMDEHMQELSSIMMDFRADQDERVAITRTQMDELISQKKEAVAAALMQAQADCKAGKDPKSVQESFKIELKAIHKSFVDDRSKIVDDSKEEHRLDVTAKTEARTEINTDFRLRMKNLWSSFVNLFKTKISE